MSPGSHVRELDVSGVALLVDEEAGKAHALNGSATVVWRMLRHDPRIGLLIDDLAKAFDEERGTIADGVVSLLQNLGSLGFLENVTRSIDSIPIDIEMVPPDDDCEEPATGSQADVDFDERYLRTPPNY